MVEYLDVTKRQILPVYYPGQGQFRANNADSAAAGSITQVEIPISNNPMMVTGIRVLNTYEIPGELQDINGLAFLAHLDQQQTVQTDLTQQNVIVRPMAQALLTGSGGGAAPGAVHWHPFEAPYPFRGGNNINLTFVRQISYPAEITAVMVECALVGWMYMSDAVPDAAPGSTGFYSTAKG